MNNRNIRIKRCISGTTKLTTPDTKLLKAYYASRDKLGVELAEHMLTCMELVESAELFLSNRPAFDAKLKAHVQSRKKFKKALMNSLAAQIHWNDALKKTVRNT
jgi:hypothetical protein